MRVKDLITKLMEVDPNLPVVMLDGSHYVSVDGAELSILEYSDFMNDGSLRTEEVVKLW